MPVMQRKEYNILVLGETGAGKSTFINGFLNYISFESIDHVLSSQVKYCIPTIFNWCGEDDKQYDVIIGRNEDKFESQELGMSATQNVKSYLFEFGNIAIRIIDTPGFGDTEGKEKDEQISEKLFQFLSVRKELRELHGIVLIYKPNINRKTTFFKYCIDHIFSKLHSDAAQNIIFVFTHTKGTNFKPGPTMGLIKGILKDIPNIKVKCEKENIFCVENGCIQYLLTYFYNEDGIIFDDDEKDNYIVPWKKSSGECIRLIKYIKSLEPHSVSNTVLINSARLYSVKLKNHLPRILEKITKEIKECQKYEEDIKTCSDDIVRLQKLLYKTTYVKREGIKHVVCRYPKCPKKHSHGKTKDPCCPNCKAFYLSWCLEISYLNSQCKICGCNEMDHVFENNKDYTGEEITIDENIKSNVEIKQKIKNHQRLRLFELKIIIKKYEAERIYIESWIKRLSKYLEESSILSDQAKFEGTNSSTNEEPISADVMERIVGTLSSLEMTGADIMALLKQENLNVEPDKIFVFEDVLNNWKEVLGQSL